MGDKFRFYAVPGRDYMAVIITEVSSLEELAQLFAQVPVAASGFFKYESFPLIERDEKYFEGLLTRVQAAK